MLKGQEKEFEFILPNRHKATIHCVDAEKFAESTRFVILSGGYSLESEAIACAEELKESVLCFGAKFRMGVDVGKDKARGFVSKHIKDSIFDEHGLRIIDDVHGISVYSEEYPTSCMSFSAVGIANPRGKSFFVDEVCNLILSPRIVDNKTKLAMELLTASYFELSSRSRFLTLVLAAESILKPDKRSEDVKLVVEELINHTKLSDIDLEEKNSILGSLNWLYHDSISQSIRKMAVYHLPGKQYNGLSSDKFIKKCYEARSRLVHEGGVDESKYNIGELAASLEVYMADMLSTLACI